MAKATSPIRLQADLMQAARLAGERQHRSAAEQVEYWASLGRQIAQFVSPDSLLEIQAGLARLKVESTIAQPVNPESVFDAVALDQQAGTLPDKVTQANPRYQASETQPGYLERIDGNGTRTPGTFQHGTFIPLDEEIA